MKINMIGSFVRNHPFGTEIAFAKGLKEIGVEVFTWDPSTQNEKINLVSNADATIVFKDHGEITHHILEQQQKRSIVIEYQPDDIRAPGIRGLMKHMRQFCDYAFTFDDTGARVAQEELGYKKARKLLVTADPEIYYPMDLEKDIDLCFVGNFSNPDMHASRRSMLGILDQAGYNVKFYNSLYDVVEINKLYNRSKIVLNHATDVGQGFGLGYGYQCRHFEVGMARACLLSNTILGNEDDGPKGFVPFNSKSDLLEAVDTLLDWYDGPIYEHSAYDYHEEIMTNHTPRQRAEEIVDFIEEVKSE